MERLKRIVKLPHRLWPVQSSKVSPGCVVVNLFCYCQLWNLVPGQGHSGMAPKPYEKNIPFNLFIMGSRSFKTTINTFMGRMFRFKTSKTKKIKTKRIQ